MQSAQFQLHAEIESRHWWFVARRRILRTLVGEALPVGRVALVVDVGCGTGANIAALATENACLGIDTSAEAIDAARRRFPQVEFRCGRAPDDLADVLDDVSLVLLSDVLEHVQDDFRFLSELLAALRPGAQVLLTVPADLDLWSPHDESFGHWRRYDRARLEQVWAGLPVAPRLVSYFNTRLYPLVKRSRASSRRQGEAAGAAGTDFWLPPPPLNWTLQQTFAGEARRLVRALHGAARPYERGVSLVALLRREEGEFAPRSKPEHIAADRYDPDAAACDAARRDRLAAGVAQFLAESVPSRN
jgi:SAM-dependent methyltransferase